MQLSCERFLALAKSSLYWMSPMYGATASEVPRETQFLLLQLPGGTFALLLPLIDAGAFRATLRPPRCGRRGGAEWQCARAPAGSRQGAQFLGHTGLPLLAMQAALRPAAHKPAEQRCARVTTVCSIYFC